MKPEKLKAILEAHAEWVKDFKKGTRADLAGADLNRASLNRANLAGANLSGSDLAGADLTGADLNRANLTGANLAGADLNRANLNRANLTGADLAGANLNRANLTGADLAGAYLNRADLAGANLTGADLNRANLTGASLNRANLAGANLTGANLNRANLTGAKGCRAPIVPNIDQKILEALESGGTIEMTNWHLCATTHCRAGWAIHLAGDSGYALEDRIGSAAAGALIYAASRPGKPVPNFYATNNIALESIRADATDSAVTKGIKL